jgi:hypothetical protein
VSSVAPLHVESNDSDTRELSFVVNCAHFIHVSTHRRVFHAIGCSNTPTLHLQILCGVIKERRKGVNKRMTQTIMTWVSTLILIYRSDVAPLFSQNRKRQTRHKHGTILKPSFLRALSPLAALPTFPKKYTLINPLRYLFLLFAQAAGWPHFSVPQIS